MNKETEEEKEVTTNLRNRCSDFDNDCESVTSHYRCFIGCSSVINGITVTSGIADGYCPFVQLDN